MRPDEIRPSAPYILRSLPAFGLGAALVLTACSTVVSAQAPAPATAPTEEANAQASTLTVQSTLVMVPALVKTKSGQVVYTLTAKDFVLTDNGVEQPLKLDEDTGGEPLALVVVVQTGGDAREHLQQYQALAPTLGAVVGNVPHKIAVVSFDSKPILEQKFSPDVDKTSGVIADLPPGDNGAAILDAVTYAVDLLRRQPVVFRRAILLLSETLDHGSKTSIDDTVRVIGDTNTAVYSMAFNSTRAETKKEASKFSSSEPGPAHGCFAKDPNADPDTAPSRTVQNYDCVAELLPPIRLAKMAMQALSNNFRRNVAESVAQLTGGEYYKFHDVKSLEGDLVTLSNHVPNRYMLSFHPTDPQPGFHTLQLKLPAYANMTIEARNGYWIEDKTQ